jgi:hypothetical protein
MNISINGIKDFLFGVLILSPQVSISIAGVNIDSSVILLFILTVDFLCNRKVSKLKGAFLQHKFLWLLFFFLLLLILQSFFNDASLIKAHLVMGEGREIGSFGSYQIHNVVFFNSVNIRLISVFCFAFLISNRFASKNLVEIKKMLLSILLAGCFIQLFIILLENLDLLNSFVREFMVENINKDGDIHTGFKTMRFGLNRYSAGFSEPSFFATVIWIILSAIYLLKIVKNNLFTKRDSYFIGISLVFFILTTISIFMAMSLFLFIAFLINISLRRTVVILFIGVLIVSLFPHIMSSDFFRENELSSVFIRFFLTTDISDLSLYSILFGTQIGYVYSNPPLTSLVLQFGLIYSFIFTTIIIWKIPLKFYLILSGIYVIIVSPNLATPYFFLHMFLLSTILWRVKYYGLK